MFFRYLFLHVQRGNESNQVRPRGGGVVIPRKDKIEAWDNWRETERNKQTNRNQMLLFYIILFLSYYICKRGDIIKKERVAVADMLSLNEKIMRIIHGKGLAKKIKVN